MEKLDLHGKTGFIIGGTRVIDTYEYHNTWRCVYPRRACRSC